VLVLRLGVALVIAGLVIGGPAMAGIAAGPRPSSPAASLQANPQASTLPAGTYTSRAFQPAVTYTLPAGWENPADSPDFFQLRPTGSDSEGIYLFNDPKPASQATDCPETAQPLAGGSSAEMVAWIRSLPGLVVSEPVPVTIGGLTGVSLDLGIVNGWTASCPFADGTPTVPLFVGTNGDFRWVIAGNEQLRLALLDGPDGTVVVDVDAFDGRVMGQLLAAADPIVKSFSFAKP
jgi:hypothetical protein